MVQDMGFNIRLFADDTSLFIIVDDPVTAAGCINTDLDKISNWASTWLVTFNPSKTETLLFSRKMNTPLHPPVFMQNQKYPKLTLINILVSTSQKTVLGMNTLTILQLKHGLELTS